MCLSNFPLRSKPAPALPRRSSNAPKFDPCCSLAYYLWQTRVCTRGDVEQVVRHVVVDFQVADFNGVSLTFTGWYGRNTGARQWVAE